MSSGPEDTESTDADLGTIREGKVYCDRCAEWVAFDLRGPIGCPEHGGGRVPPGQEG